MTQEQLPPGLGDLFGILRRSIRINEINQNAIDAIAKRVAKDPTSRPIVRELDGELTYYLEELGMQIPEEVRTQLDKLILDPDKDK